MSKIFVLSVSLLCALPSTAGAALESFSGRVEAVSLDRVLVRGARGELREFVSDGTPGNVMAGDAVTVYYILKMEKIERRGGESEVDIPLPFPGEIDDRAFFGAFLRNLEDRGILHEGAGPAMDGSEGPGWPVPRHPS